MCVELKSLVFKSITTVAYESKGVFFFFASVESPWGAKYPFSAACLFGLLSYIGLYILLTSLYPSRRRPPRKEREHQ